ncbi:MAG: ferritin-like domain-containing protein, partial [Pseudomonadales bacterium]|nr:ferritin-like domain-containing protein [Pseudomonadales bacterium]
AVYRFRGLPAAFHADWVSCADDESRHFMLLRERLLAHGHDYADFPAHNGLWEMCEKTAHDGLARMALVPRVLEARGLDVTPGMIDKLRNVGDGETADVLEIILREEVAHVAAGSRWYRWYCERAGVEPRARFKALLVEFAGGYLHGPFNLEDCTNKSLYFFIVRYMSRGIILFFSYKTMPYKYNPPEKSISLRKYI